MRAAPLTALTALAFTPVFQWIALRARDGSDEPWNLAALAFAVCFVLHAARCAPGARASLAWPLALVLAYVVSYAVLTPIPRGVLAMAALTALVSPPWLGCRFQLGLWIVLVLGLPVISSLQFYAGYPLRVAVAECAATWLRGAGYAVHARGVALAIGERVVLVDVPCSGLKMLWAGGFATGALALVHRLDVRRTAGASVCAAALLFAGNVLRAAALFQVELGRPRLPPWAHDGVGLAAFALTLAAIVRVVSPRARGVRHA